jgi:hypothetical protein
MGRESIFKPTIGNESLHQGSNDNGFRIVNSDTQKIIVVKSMMFLYQNIRRYTCTFPNGKTHNQISDIDRQEMAFEYTLCMIFQGS